MAGDDAAAEFERRQGTLGLDQQRGDKYIRSLLTAGAVAVLRHARNRPTRDGEWVRALLARKPTKVAAVALANKTARIVWAVTMREDGYPPKEVFGSRHSSRQPVQHARRGRDGERSSRGSGRPEKVKGAERRAGEPNRDAFLTVRATYFRDKMGEP